MRMTEALGQERQREDSTLWNKMYVHKEGSFCHVFEWSAWLLVSNASLERMVRKINSLDFSDGYAVWQSVCSWLGVLSHYVSFNIRCRLFLTKEMLAVSAFDRDMLKMDPI